MADAVGGKKPPGAGAGPTRRIKTKRFIAACQAMEKPPHQIWAKDVCRLVPKVSCQQLKQQALTLGQPGGQADYYPGGYDVQPYEEYERGYEYDGNLRRPGRRVRRSR